MADVNACLEAATAEPKSLANVQDDSTPPDSTPQSNSEKNYQNDIGSAVVRSNMRAPDMLSLLFKHGCLDITSSLDFSSIEEYAIHFGGFGLIHRGRLRDGTPVAIKILAQGKDGIGGANNKIEKRAAREVYNWSKSMYPNVVPLLGVTHNCGRILMVSPWMDCGTLPNHVSHCPDVNRFEL
ncbi:putative serine/threonine-protein kinase roco4, partial [Ceratobasidium sp. 392]